MIANLHLIEDEYPAQTSGNINIEAIAEVANAIPLIIPSLPKAIDIKQIMKVCDGFLFTGGRPNIHPEEYEHEVTEAHGVFDRDRDRVALPLIRACVEVGQPILGICRGFQEFNVAMGGTLHPEIRDLPGRINHRMPPDGTMDEKFALRHSVKFSEGSLYSKIFNADEVMVNSLHGQGIDVPGPRINIDGYAPDGTAEALTIEHVKGFALAVQWHPEYNAAQDTVSVSLFEAFGRALRGWKGAE
ncbi:MAG: gamma-glutamyl-gamma-aminobutyrate hydrolase family protein [Rhodospirillales bacterium]|nr:gamma-glutamyl-gamma-aminobutyrate hydrolase family protein [Rhodospirillales bacterium]